MIIPVGQRYQQTLYLLTKQDGKMVQKALQPTLFVPMTGAAEEARKELPDPSRPELVNGDFETKLPTSEDQSDGTASSVHQDTDAIPGWYYGRHVKLMKEHAFQGTQFVRFENQTADMSTHLLQGFPLDGRQVSAIRISGAIRLEGVKAGQGSETSPAIAVSLYDELRREVGFMVIGPYSGTRPWKSHSRVLSVPPQAREAIVRIGLFGATGIADFDAIKIEPIH